MQKRTQHTSRLEWLTTQTASAIALAVIGLAGYITPDLLTALGR